MQLQYRQYSNPDAQRCAELSVNAWPIAAVITDENSVRSLMDAYVRVSLIMSDYAQVCCDNGKVVGLLFGSVGGHKRSMETIGESSKLLWRFAIGRYGKIKKRFRLLVKMIIAMSKLEIYCSRFDSVIELLVVDESYRRKGIGRTLVDNFINYARENNKKSVCLGTDVESSWRFYEKHGFTRHKEYYDNILSFIKGKKIMSFVYYRIL